MNHTFVKLRELLAPFDCFDEENHFHWPETAEDRNEVARLLFGAELISKLDSWLEHAEKIMSGTVLPVVGALSDTSYEEKLAFQSFLAGLSDAQRSMLLRLVQDVASGVLFSTLVTFDQPPHVERINLHFVGSENDENATEAIIEAASSIDLHDELYPWIEQFSRYADAFRHNG